MIFDSGYKWRRHKKFSLHREFELCWVDDAAEAAAAAAASRVAVIPQPDTQSAAAEEAQMTAMPIAFGVVLEDEPTGDHDQTDEGEVVHVELVVDDDTSAHMR